jgi:hypothetical protein
MECFNAEFKGNGPEESPCFRPFSVEVHQINVYLYCLYPVVCHDVGFLVYIVIKHVFWLKFYFIFLFRRCDVSFRVPWRVFVDDIFRDLLLCFYKCNELCSRTMLLLVLLYVSPLSLCAVVIELFSLWSCFRSRLNIFLRAVSWLSQNTVQYFSPNWIEGLFKVKLAEVPSCCTPILPRYLKNAGCPIRSWSFMCKSTPISPIILSTYGVNLERRMLDTVLEGNWWQLYCSVITVVPLVEEAG